MKKYILIVTAFIAIILLSESIYTYRNRPEFMETVYLFLAKQAANSGKFEDSFNFLKDAANKSPDTNIRKYEVYNPDKLNNLDFVNLSQPFKDGYKKYLTSIPLDKFSEDKIFDITKFFYNIALIADSTGDKKMTQYFLESSIYWQPFFSYYHVELANYYLLNGDKDNAKKVLDLCSNIDVTKDHCTEYLKDNYNTGYAEKVGFLKDQIDSFRK